MRKLNYQGMGQVFESIIRVQIIVASIALSLLMFTQVITRYFFDSPFPGIEEVAILLGVWIYFPAMGYATKTKDHIYGGIVELVVKDEYTLSVIRFVIYLISIVSAAVFCYFAVKYAYSVFDKGRLSISLRWYRYLWSTSMALGFILMLGYFLLDAVKEWNALLAMKGQRKALEVNGITQVTKGASK
ncbi:TRAP transporter small permease [Aliivibrio kagoshimensis]|uniref:TRAP transporter small permease n=1 Tax=Aliivibrio kagoshimensis TaxID=2910230 RepID=UPI003D0EA64B